MDYQKLSRITDSMATDKESILRLIKTGETVTLSDGTEVILEHKPDSGIKVFSYVDEMGGTREFVWFETEDPVDVLDLDRVSESILRFIEDFSPIAIY